jgi:hypothetical protein
MQREIAGKPAEAGLGAFGDARFAAHAKGQVRARLGHQRQHRRQGQRGVEDQRARRTWWRPNLRPRHRA